MNEKGTINVSAGWWLRKRIEELAELNDMTASTYAKVILFKHVKSIDDGRQDQ